MNLFHFYLILLIARHYAWMFEFFFSFFKQKLINNIISTNWIKSHNN
jgi:hypothetical protein